MQVKFDAPGYRWLAVRQLPNKEAHIMRKIETGLTFEVEETPVKDGEGRDWYHIPGEYPGYVMAEFVHQVDDDSALHKMKIGELRKLAKESGITLQKGATKAAIIEALLNG